MCVPVEASHSICGQFEKDTDSSNLVVTINETWISFYDLEAKQNRWNEDTLGLHGLRKFYFQKSAGKEHSSVFGVAKES